MEGNGTTEGTEQSEAMRTDGDRVPGRRRQGNDEPPYF